MRKHSTATQRTQQIISTAGGHRPGALRAAALTHLSSEDLFVLREVVKAQESRPVRPLSEPESRALEAYYPALALESRGPASFEPNNFETPNDIPTQNQNR